MFLPNSLNIISSVKGASRGTRILERRKRRSVRDIVQFETPQQVYTRIVSKHYPYHPFYEEEYVFRDQAMMSLCYLTGGRISEVCGGPQWQTEVPAQKVQKTDGTIHHVGGKWKVIGRHPGLTKQDVELTETHVIIRNMKVVKRSQRVIERRGIAVTQRSELMFPLHRGLGDNIFWDQLVPFSTLVKRYITEFKPSSKLFPYEAKRAYYIIEACTGMNPHWLRAMSEWFYGSYLLKGKLELSSFLNVLDPKVLLDYSRYDAKSHLANPESAMDFTWIDKEVSRVNMLTFKRYSSSLDSGLPSEIT